MPIVIHLQWNLTASTGVSPAYWNWSNGATGASINVNHGGLFEVTLTDGNGCSSTRLLDIEGEPNLDFFPVGCYEYCREDMPLMFPGPYGNFDSWRLFRDGVVVQSGAGPIINLAITDEGDYMLQVIDNSCVFETGIMSVVFDDEKCEMICDHECYVKIAGVNPSQIQECLYEFSADVILGECTDIIDYQWYVNNVPVPGGAVMSYVFPAPNVTYYICLEVTGEDDFGNQCKDTYCFKYQPTCKCECDVDADFDIIQLAPCEYAFVSTSTSNECTEIYQHYWTITYNGETYTLDGEEIHWGFDTEGPLRFVYTLPVGMDRRSARIRFVKRLLIHVRVLPKGTTIPL